MTKRNVRKLAFYADHNDDASYQDVISGRVASSGSASSVNGLLPLATKYDLTVFHQMGSEHPREQWLGATWVKVADVEDFKKALADEPDRPSDVIVRSNGDSLTLVRHARDLGIRPILMMNNDLRGAPIRRLFRNGLSLIVARSIGSLRNYEAFDFCRKVHLVRHSIPHLVVAKPGEAIPGKVVWVGATREEKGFHHVLAVWNDVKARVPGAELHVYGSIRLHVADAEVGWTNVMTPEFERVHLSGIASNQAVLDKAGIRLHGVVGKQHIADSAQTAWVGVVNPNVSGGWETFCISAVELQAAGCPVVGGNAGGLRETVSDGVSGLLINDRAGLADALVTLLNDHALRARLSEGALEYSATFASSDTEALQWEKALHQDPSTTLDGLGKTSIIARLVRPLRSDFASRGYASARRRLLLS